MIYIIDDKKTRQKDNAPWLSESIHSDKFIAIYNTDEIARYRQDIFNNGTLIAFHDSFFKDPVNQHAKKDVLEIKIDLMDYCQKNKIQMVCFSGDFSMTSIDKNGFVHSLPVEVFYKNLLAFFNNLPTIEPLILGYGANYKFEELIVIRDSIMQRLFNVDYGELICRNNNILTPAILSETQKILSLTQTANFETILQDLNTGKLSKLELMHRINQSINNFMYA